MPRVEVASEGRWITCPDEFRAENPEMCAPKDGRYVLNSSLYTADHAFRRDHSDSDWTTLSPRIYPG